MHTTTTRGFLLRQFNMSWALMQYHLEGLSTAECLWRPAKAGLHVRQTNAGNWQADWPEHEGYDLGPPSIAWLTWHVIFWWSMVLDATWGSGSLTREQVLWPGSADAVRLKLKELELQWRTRLESLTDADLQSGENSRWPLADKPFGDVVAWVNIELMKNAAEVGYVRFLHAVRDDGRQR
ncbi:MAG TPA: DinB family protein [Firmicutes bacterium]|nr:DinB family protein [Bacillota bacterium]